jgi:uncharacterized protein YegP (UPF0339 family)
MEAKFVVFKDIDGKFRFHLEAPNGEIIATSEGYSSNRACLDGIATVRKYALAAQFEDKTILPSGR